MQFFKNSFSSILKVMCTPSVYFGLFLFLRKLFITDLRTCFFPRYTFQVFIHHLISNLTAIKMASILFRITNMWKCRCYEIKLVASTNILSILALYEMIDSKIWQWLSRCFVITLYMTGSRDTYTNSSRGFQLTAYRKKRELRNLV